MEEQNPRPQIDATFGLGGARTSLLRLLVVLITSWYRSSCHHPTPDLQ